MHPEQHNRERLNLVLPVQALISWLFMHVGRQSRRVIVFVWNTSWWHLRQNYSGHKAVCLGLSCWCLGAGDYAWAWDSCVKSSQVRMFHTHSQPLLEMRWALLWRLEDCGEEEIRKRTGNRSHTDHALINKIDVTISPASITDRCNLTRQRFTSLNFNTVRSVRNGLESLVCERTWMFCTDPNHTEHLWDEFEALDLTYDPVWKGANSHSRDLAEGLPRRVEAVKAAKRGLNLY